MNDTQVVAGSLPSNGWYCSHKLPLIYDMETGEAEYLLGQVYVCPKCDTQWMVVPSTELPELNMWRQPHIKNMRAK